MAKTCLEFGFYDSKEEINMLCVSILGFLNGTFDITTDEEVDLLFPSPIFIQPLPLPYNIYRNNNSKNHISINRKRRVLYSPSVTN